MALVINHNLGSKKALNLLEKNQTALGKALKAAASGLKIKDASDGASEFAISRRLEIEEWGLGQDIQNVKTGGDLLAVAEGGIRDVIENLRDMKQLAINAANDTNTDADRATIEKEFASRKEAIIDIAATTNYNGKLLLAGDYSHYISKTDSIWVPPRKISTSIPTGQNSLEKMTSNFTGTSINPFTKSNIESSGKTYTTNTQFSGGEVKINFSGAKPATGSLSYPSSFDKQGFAILCGGCDQFINIIFSADFPPQQSAYTMKADSSNYQARTYVIGIEGVTNEKTLEQALFNGIKSCQERLQSYKPYEEAGNSYAKMCEPYCYDTADGKDIIVDATHNFRIKENPDGSYSFTKTERTNTGFYDEGTVITNPIEIEIPGYWIPGRSEQLGNPLVIHDTTRAGSAIHVFIDSMHPRAITGKVPVRDPVTWEIIPQKDPNTGEILKDNDGNPIPAAYIDPDPTLEDAHVVTREKALQAIDILDMAMNYALNQITDIGAYRMRLEQDEDKITVQQESAISSKSTIQDADMAAIMTNFTKNNVLTQSAQLMLAQSNQNASRVLSLLQ